MTDNVQANSNDASGPIFKTDEDTGNVHVPVSKIELGADNSFDGYLSDTNPMPIKSLSTVDSNNSSTSLLTSNTDYTGTSTDLLSYGGITVNVFADQDSDPNGLLFEFSSDNTNWFTHETYTYLASTTRTFNFEIVARYFRVTFQNGGTGQAAFRLQTLLHKFSVNPVKNHRADANLTIDTPTIATKSIITAQLDGSGDYVPVEATLGGNLKVSVNQISDGLNTGSGNAGAETIRVAVATDDVNLAAIKTASELLDDTVYTDTGTWSATTSKHLLAGGVYTSTPRTVANADTVPVSLDSAGNVVVSGTVAATNSTLAVTGGGVESGALRVTLASDSTGVISIDDGGGIITVDGTVTADLSATDNAVLDAINTNTSSLAQADGGTLGNGVLIQGDDGTDRKNINVDPTTGDVQVDVTNTVTVSGTVTANLNTSTLYKNIDVDESEDEIKGTAGTIHWIHVMNMSATVKYLKLYNATAASVVVGTTVPDLTFPVPTQGDTNGAGFTLPIPVGGINFSTAITIAATTGLADADTGAPGANEVVVNLGYN